MAAKTLPLEGEVFTGWKPGVIKVMKVTIGAAAQNPDVVLSTQVAYPIVNVPIGVFVVDVLCSVDVAFNASVTLAVGDGNSTAGYLTSTKIAPQSAVTSGLMTRATLPTAGAYAGGLKYLVADTIDVLVGGADVSAGKATIFVVYIQDVNQL